jgi:CHC2 zinc finger
MSIPQPSTAYAGSTTEAVLAAVESLCWDLAEIEAGPDAFANPGECRLLLLAHLDDARRELDRRRRFRSMPSAPVWPDGRAELAEIKQRVELADFIERHAAVVFRRVGSRLWGHCPFPDHVDPRPSFCVTPAKQLWCCFGCRRGGDVFSFALAWFDSRTFADAVDLVAREAGVERRTPKRGLKIRAGEVRRG